GDWSSDVCSSDLVSAPLFPLFRNKRSFRNQGSSCASICQKSKLHTGTSSERKFVETMVSLNYCCSSRNPKLTSDDIFVAQTLRNYGNVACQAQYPKPLNIEG